MKQEGPTNNPPGSDDSNEKVKPFETIKDVTYKIYSSSKKNN